MTAAQWAWTLTSAPTAPAIRVLGTMELAQADAPSARKIRQLLAVLARHAGQFVSVNDLKRELWHDEIRSASTTVQTYVMRLRRIPGLRIETRNLGYELMLKPLDVDAHRFARFVDTARRQAQEGRFWDAQDTLRAAESLWRGEPLEDLDRRPLLSSWAGEIQDRRDTGLHLRRDIDLRLGRHRELVDELRSALRMNLAREDTAAQLMVALYRSQRQVEALAVYQQIREFLADEYGVEPGPGLRRLQQRILSGDEALEWKEGH